MRKIKLTTRFEKDLKKVGLNAELIEVLHYLLHDKPLPEVYLDHQLKGELKQYRDCHVKNNLLLLYKVTDDGKTIELYRLGSHSDLF